MAAVQKQFLSYTEATSKHIENPVNVYQLKKRYNDKLPNESTKGDKCIVLQEEYLVCDTIICDKVPSLEQVKELLQVPNKCVGFYRNYKGEPQYFIFKNQDGECDHIDGESLETYYVKISRHVIDEKDITLLAFALNNDLDYIEEASDINKNLTHHELELANHAFKSYLKEHREGVRGFRGNNNLPPF
jgi:hypothetical protein